MKRLLSILLCLVLILAMLPVSSLAISQYATVVGGWLRLRSAASFEATTITSYYTGTKVQILGSQGSWYKVKTPDSRIGYMYGQYLSFSGGTYTGDAYVTSYNGYGVRLRQGPGTAYRIIRTYEVGTPVTVLQKGNYWCYISIYGTKGYMMTQFLDFGGGGGSETPVCYATIWSENGLGVRLRQGPGKNYSVIGCYKVGTTVAVLQKGTVWDKVRVGSRTGWMMNEFLIYQGTTKLTGVALNDYNPVVGDTLVATVTPTYAGYTCQWYSGGSPVSGSGDVYYVSESDVGNVISVIATGTGSYSGSVGATTNPVKAEPSVKYDLDVYSGVDVYAKGSYAYDEEVCVRALTANASKGETFVFDHWAVSGLTLTEEESTASELYFLMPSNDVTFVGIYTEPAGESYVLSVTDDELSYSQSYKPGKTVTVSAVVPEGKTFLYWIANGVVLANPTLEEISFTMPYQDVMLTAIYEDAPVVSITGVTLNNTKPVVGDTLMASVLPAGATATYQWFRDGSSIPGAHSSSYLTTESDIGCCITVLVTGTGSYSGTASTFTSPVKSGTATEYNLTVINGTDVAGAGKYKAGDSVVVASEDLSSLNLVFEKWSASGITLTAEEQKASTLVFTMPENAVTITGVYKQVAEDTYTLNLFDGTSINTFNYTAGTNVTVSASVPEGKKFDQWSVSGITLTDITQQTFIFTMPANDVSLSAECSDAPKTSLETVSLNLSAPSVGQTLTATLSPSGATATYQWFRGGTGISGATGSSYTLTAEDEGYLISVTATGTGLYTGSVQDCTASPVAPGTYKLTVTGGTVSGGEEYFAEGETVTITAQEDSTKVFSGWTAEGITLSTSAKNKKTLTFTMPGNDVTVTGNYIIRQVKYTLIVNDGGTSDGSLVITGASVEITATSSEEFDCWIVEGVELDEEEKSNRTISFTMPENDVTLTAQYKSSITPPTPEVEPETPEVEEETPEVEKETEDENGDSEEPLPSEEENNAENEEEPTPEDENGGENEEA